MRRRRNPNIVRIFNRRIQPQEFQKMIASNTAPTTYIQSRRPRWAPDEIECLLSKVETARNFAQFFAPPIEYPPIPVSDAQQQQELTRRREELGKQIWG